MFSKITTGAFAALVFLGVSAHGAIVTDSFSQSFASTAVGTPSFTVTLPKFDSTLGTLLSVELSLATTNSGTSLAFDNEAGVGGTVSLNINVAITAAAGAGPALSVTTNSVAMGTSSVTADEPGDGFGDFLGTDSYKITLGGSNSASSSGGTPAVLTQFTALLPGETFLSTISNVVNSSHTAAGMFGPTLPIGGNYFGAVTVAYTYLLVPVPEAGTLLWGACLVGVAAFRRPRGVRA